jgi:hypothetical protein
MKQPITVTVDPDYPSAYLAYEDPSRRARSISLAWNAAGEVVEEGIVHDPELTWTGVVIDVDGDERPVGIEIIDVREDEAVQLARDYAAAHGLAFPARLEPVARHSA